MDLAPAIPIENRLSNPPQFPVRAPNQALPDATPEDLPFDPVHPSALPAGLPLEDTVVTGVDAATEGAIDPTIKFFYGNRAPHESESLPGFIEAGGVVLLQHFGGQNDAEYVLASLAEGGRSPLPPTVTIGDYTGVVIHADPIIRNDLRPWHVYWADGVLDLTIIGDYEPAVLIEFAQSLYCEG